jgi:hypothetical protein
MTNPQGKGTTNVAVNLLDEERAILVRLAVVDDRSLGDVIRRLAVAGLKANNPDAADQLEQLRRKHRQQTLSL